MTGHDETRQFPQGRSTTVLVYDKTRGNVQHVHEVITMDGGTAPSEAEAAARALELARLSAGFFRRKASAKLATSVSRESVDPMLGARRVNARSGELLPVRKPARPK